MTCFFLHLPYERSGRDAENLNAGIALTILLADILVLRISYTVLFKYDPEPVDLKIGCFMT